MMNQPTDTPTERNSKAEARRLRAQAVDSAAKILGGGQLNVPLRTSEMAEITVKMAERLYQYMVTGQ